MPQISVNISSIGDNTVVNVTTATRTQVIDYVLVAASAVTVIVKDEAGTEFGRYGLVAGALSVSVPSIMGAFRFTAVGDIIFNLSGAVAVTGHLTYATN